MFGVCGDASRRRPGGANHLTQSALKSSPFFNYRTPCALSLGTHEAANYKVAGFNYKQPELSFRSLATRTPALAHVIIYSSHAPNTKPPARVSLGCDVGDDDGGGGGGGDAINKTAAFELDKIYAASGGSTRAPCLSFRAGAAFACLRARACVVWREEAVGRADFAGAPVVCVFD